MGILDFKHKIFEQLVKIIENCSSLCAELDKVQGIIKNRAVLKKISIFGSMKVEKAVVINYIIYRIVINRSK